MFDSFDEVSFTEGSADKEGSHRFAHTNREGDCTNQHCNPDNTKDEQFVRPNVEDPFDVVCSEIGNSGKRGQEDERLDDRHRCFSECPPTQHKCRNNREIDGDDNVLNNERAQNNVTLGVREPPSICKRLCDNRARRDVDNSRDKDDTGHSKAEHVPDEDPHDPIENEIEPSELCEPGLICDQCSHIKLQSQEEQEENNPQFANSADEFAIPDQSKRDAADLCRDVRPNENPSGDVARDN